MALSDVSEIAPALASASCFTMQGEKASYTGTAGFLTSTWRVSGGAGGVGVSPTTWALCDNTTPGNLAFGLPNATAPDVNYLAQLDMGGFGANINLEYQFYDRLGHMGGLDGTSTAAQTVNADVTGSGSNLVERRGATNYQDVHWFAEWYLSTGSTTVNATFAVTYDDNSTGNVVVVFTGTVAQPRLLRIPPAVDGLFIKSIQTCQLSATTGAAGNFGVTAARLRCTALAESSSRPLKYDWANLPIVPIYNSSCLMMAIYQGSTSTGASRYTGRIITV